MSDYLATALGLAFTMVVCLLALHALLSPWLRRRGAPETATPQPEEKHAFPAISSQETAAVHTGTEHARTEHTRTVHATTVHMPTVHAGTTATTTTA